MKIFRITIVFLGIVGVALFIVAVAQGISPFDLVNLKNQGLGDITAYEKIKIIDAWSFVNQVSPPLPLSPVIVGIFDTGVDGTHPEFKNPNVNFGSSTSFDLTDSGDPAGSSVSHGTNVAGIIGANNISATSSSNYQSPQMNGIVSGINRLNYSLESRKIFTIFDVVGKIDELSLNNVPMINYSEAGFSDLI